MILSLIEKIRTFAGSNAIEFTLHAREKMYVRKILSTEQLFIITTYYPDKNIWLNPRKRR